MPAVLICEGHSPELLGNEFAMDRRDRWFGGWTISIFFAIAPFQALLYRGEARAPTVTIRKKWEIL